jgi:UPF0755 protein
METINQPIQPFTDITPPKPKSRFWMYILVLFIFGAFAALAFVSYALFLNKAPQHADWPVSVQVEQGTTVRAITEQLEEAKIVRSATLLYFIVTLQHDPKDIKASTYVFTEPLTAREVAKRLVAGDFDSDLISFTHYEGERATEIADNAQKEITNFNKMKFLELAVPLEGKLYPETYRIPKDFSAQQLVDLMFKTYEERTADLKQQMASHPLGEEKILVLASILEREANSPESMQIVSGILQGRMEANMPLQADASVEYVLDKPLKELTADDLKVDSPYNTYTNRGLPPTPIGNPGHDAIFAALQPTKTDYVFYITDNDGNFHYAVTYDEHLDNVNKYLR